MFRGIFMCGILPAVILLSVLENIEERIGVFGEEAVPLVAKYPVAL